MLAMATPRPAVGAVVATASPTRDETGPTELPPVEVEQAAADHDAARRRGDTRVRPLGEGGDRPTGGVEGVDVAKDAEARRRRWAG